ncbi:protein GLUTAMINE DUMPER 5-like [Impatiens glandulifera]|uniref:protein GLUTAMINE DUMPER 5-like n=1 Tax=Impatiens glandulifera TaxID=253017 RepID=UPI001FB0F799|nr:protein GLUTAMINE DUMPER 5-like [Impatiens glandulifera]
MRGSVRILNTETKFSPAPAAEAHIHRSPWHSPLPYFFGGLAAMLGLIAFALLMLACSYFKNERDGEDAAAAAGEKRENAGKMKSHVFEEKILVIMAGNINPTFLATPMSCRRSLVAGDSQGKRFDGEKEKLEEGEEKPKQEDVHIQIFSLQDSNQLL